MLQKWILVYGIISVKYRIFCFYCDLFIISSHSFFYFYFADVFFCVLLLTSFIIIIIEQSSSYTNTQFSTKFESMICMLYTYIYLYKYFPALNTINYPCISLSFFLSLLFTTTTILSADFDVAKS